jgi:hypothetical protein
VVTTSCPTPLIRGRKKGFDFFLSQELDRLALEAFVGNGQNPLSEGDTPWLFKSGKLEKGMYCGKPHITSAGGISALFLQMIEEASNKRRSQILDCQLGGTFFQRPLGETEKQSKGVAVARDSIRACLSLPGETIGKVGFHQRREGCLVGHGSSLLLDFSNRRVAKRNNWGVAEMYQ